MYYVSFFLCLSNCYTPSLKKSIGYKKGLYALYIKTSTQILKPFTEMCKTKSGNAPSFINDIFIQKVPSYELRDGGNIFLPTVKKMRFGTELCGSSGRSSGGQTLPAVIKKSESLSMFEKKIKMNMVSCDCRLCKRYVENLGYI